METITDHSSLISELGGDTVVAGGLEDCTRGRVQQWRFGNRIPPEYWPGIIRLAEAKGLAFVTSDWLMNTLRPRAMPGERQEASAA